LNWDALGAVAELLGAVGVIVSLLYLATQIRQNTRSQKVAAYSANRQALSQINQLIAGNDEVLRVVHLSSNGREAEFSPEDRTRMNFLLTLMLRNWEESHALREQGLLDEATWQRTQTSLKRLVTIPYFRSYWESGNFGFDPYFTRHIDGLLSGAQKP